MITLTIRPKDQICRITKMLEKEQATASNIKSRVNRHSVQTALNLLLQKLKLFKTVPQNGLILFCGLVENDEIKEKQINLCIEPLRPVPSTWHRCDNKFQTDMLVELMSDENSYGFIVMDGSQCLFGSLQGNSKNTIHKFSVDLPRKHGRGGQSALRFARLRVEKRHVYLQKVAEKAEELFLENGECTVAGIVLAGWADFKDELNQSNMLNPKLKEKIIKIVDVAHGGEIGFEQAIGLAADCLSNVKLIQEKKLLGHFFDEIRKDDGKYCFGIKETMKILETGAMKTLLCWENLDIQRIKIKNEQNEELVLYEKDLTRFENKAPDSRMEILESGPLLDWLVEHFKDFGTSLEIISDKSQEGNQFVMGFGGFGGILRYQVDLDCFQTEDTTEDLQIKRI